MGFMPIKKLRFKFLQGTKFLLGWLVLVRWRLAVNFFGSWSKHLRSACYGKSVGGADWCDGMARGLSDWLVNPIMTN